MPQQIESFGVGGHEAVLDAVVHHLHEVAGAARAAMQVAVRRRTCARRYVFAQPPGASDANNGASRVDGGGVAADHEAIAVLETPDAAADADVEVVQPAFAERRGAAHVVDEMRVAAVDQRVAGSERAARARR